jgi:hypothetical protein
VLVGRRRGVGGSYLTVGRQHDARMAEIHVSDELKERLEGHAEEDESIQELIEELVNIYETEGAFMQEGYSE